MDEQHLLIHYLIAAYKNESQLLHDTAIAIGRLMLARNLTLVTHGDWQFRVQDGVLVIRHGHVCIAQYALAHDA